MKKKYKVSLIIILVFVISLCIFFYSKSLNKVTVDNNAIGIYLEDDYESNTYTLSALRSIPDNDYIFNAEKTNNECPNATFSYDSINNKVLTTSNKSIKCNLYFKVNLCLPIGTTYYFPYQNNAQEFNVTCGGKYKVELWGAQGNYYNSGNSVNYSGKGGYVSGNISLARNTILYVFVGEHSHDNLKYYSAMYNAGSTALGSYGVCYNASGGGATDIRYFGDNYIPTSSDLEWNSTLGLNSRIMVAGGGGGSSYRNDSNYTYNGHGGGIVGTESYYCGNKNCIAGGGTQMSGGYKMTNNTYSAADGLKDGSFGFGGDSVLTGSAAYGGAGGGGYYGGGGGGHMENVCRTGGGGGSSYISGHTGCVAIAEGSTSEPREVKISGCTTGTTNRECSIHYSGLEFIEGTTKMIDGAGYPWTNVVGTTYERMPAAGEDKAAYYEEGVGHTGNGYARITYLGK